MDLSRQIAHEFHQTANAKIDIGVEHFGIQVKYVGNSGADFSLEALLAVLAAAPKKGGAALAKHQGKQPKVHVIDEHTVYFFFDSEGNFPMNVSLECGIVGTGQLASAMVGN
jgi:hypothetical protein